MCQSVKPKVYGAVPLSAKGRKKSLHQCTGIVGHYSFWIDTWTQYESCAISPKQGPCAFLLGENLIRNWSFLQSQKSSFFWSREHKTRERSCYFLSTCTKGAPFGTGRERERAWHLSCVFISSVPQALDGFAGSYILGTGLVFGWGTLGQALKRS